MSRDVQTDKKRVVVRANYCGYEVEIELEDCDIENEMKKFEGWA